MFPRGLGTGLGAISLADAIARQENTPAGLNNPGALTAAPNRYCQLGKQGILVQFCSYQDGLDALNNQIQLNANRGMDLNSFFASYAPKASGNDPVTYVNNVSSWTGIDPTVPLASIDPGMLFTNYSSVDVIGTVDDGSVASLLGGDFSGVDWGLIGLGILGIWMLTNI